MAKDNETPQEHYKSQLISECVSNPYDTKSAQLQHKNACHALTYLAGYDGLNDMDKTIYTLLYERYKTALSKNPEAIALAETQSQTLNFTALLEKDFSTLMMTDINWAAFEKFSEIPAVNTPIPSIVRKTHQSTPPKR